MQRPLGAQISHMLKSRGVSTIFGIPGVHNQEMYRGIEEAGLTHVLARHEQGAGFMADGYARASGQPGVAYVITGPGLCNALTPMGQAWSDSVPLLVISSCLDDTSGTHGQLHQMRDQLAAGASVSDWSLCAGSPGAAYTLIDRALTEFATMRPRTRHITVPIAQLEGQADAPPPLAVTGLSRARACAKGTAEALRGAKRPLFILGGGARHAAAEARAVIAATGAAVFTTYAGRGIIAPECPTLFGSYLGRPDSARVIGSADLVVAVGTTLSECDIWRSDLGRKAPMIRVDIDAAELGDRQGAETVVQGDAQSFFADLAQRLADQTPQADWTAKEVAETRKRWRSEVEAERPGLLPVIEALKAALPDDAMIYSDMTQFAYAAKEVWDMAAPGHWHHPTGFGTLGYAMPAAIGGAIARPGLATLAIAGDYGFQYTLQELATAVELGLSLPIILWDNGKLGEIEDSMIRAQIAPNAVVQKNPDFGMLARAYGAKAAEPQSLAEIAEAVSTALKAPVPTLIRLTPDLS
ncbi:acetolactate synthase isozyme1 large subunit [Alphaproteobacteria bacterium KMM 3653]|uniref:Acetolactate synthase isozyme1 large subunit n=1 Tax=Harenicola maris TaxID=2841044 RepID=A0AAP2CQV5_9RHOB|nr:acetolactate synthase isozyme1 large subunit [Harenicola maris]